jgi:arylsulfatase
LANATYPEKYKGTIPNKLAGTSLSNLLFGKDDEIIRDEPLFWERAGNRAVRDGKWKLVSIYPSLKWELYDLETDAGETKNLAAKFPLVVDRLSVKYFNWARKNGVVNYFEIENRDAEDMKQFRLSKTQAKESNPF